MNKKKNGQDQKQNARPTCNCGHHPSMCQGLNATGVPSKQETPRPVSNHQCPSPPAHLLASFLVGGGAVSLDIGNVYNQHGIKGTSKLELNNKN